VAYSKREGKDLILVVVNLDPSFAQGTTVHWNMDAFGFSSNEFEVKDLLDGSTMKWNPHTYVSLNPTRPVGKVAHIVSVKI
jgi:starch synthase (maltosyl-transferring)